MVLNGFEGPNWQCQCPREALPTVSLKGGRLAQATLENVLYPDGGRTDGTRCPHPVSVTQRLMWAFVYHLREANISTGKKNIIVTNGSTHPPSP